MFSKTPICLIVQFFIMEKPDDNVGKVRSFGDFGLGFEDHKNIYGLVSMGTAARNPLIEA